MPQDLGAMLQQAAQAQAQLRMETAQIKRMLYEAQKEKIMALIQQHLAREEQKKAEKKAKKKRNIQMGALGAAAIGAGFLAPALAASTAPAVAGAGTGLSAGIGAGALGIPSSAGMTALGAAGAAATATPIFSPVAALSTLGINVDDLLKYGKTGWGER